MEPSRSLTWLAAALSLVSACIIASAFAYSLTQNFHARLALEGFAASALVVLSMQFWLQPTAMIFRLGFSLLGIAMIILVGQIALGNGFPSWFENAIWYVPISSLIGIAYRATGARFSLLEGDFETERAQQSYSIRDLLIATGGLAAAFAAVGYLTRLRTNNEVYAIRWLLDSLTLTVPMAVLSSLSFTNALRDRKPVCATLVLLSPIIGIGVCRIYGWNHYQSVVVVALIATGASVGTGYLLLRAGYRLVQTLQTQQ